eukprot:UN29099
MKRKFDQTIEYTLHNGVQMVNPYWHANSRFVKLPKYNEHTTLKTAITEHFKILENEVGENRNLDRLFENNCIFLNDNIGTGNERVKIGDRLTYVMHRHEPPVSIENNNSINILETINNISIINKPSSLPVHPRGAYYWNTLWGILVKKGIISENQSKKTHMLNRIDKLTSGTILLTDNYNTAKKVHELFERRKVRKTYYARVQGRFPSDEIVVKKHIIL